MIYVFPASSWKITLATLAWILVQWKMIYPMTELLEEYTYNWSSISSLSSTWSKNLKHMLHMPIGSQGFCGNHITGEWTLKFSLGSDRCQTWSRRFRKRSRNKRCKDSKRLKCERSVCLGPLDAPLDEVSSFWKQEGELSQIPYNTNNEFGSGRHLFCVWCILQVRTKRDQKYSTCIQSSKRRRRFNPFLTS